MKYVILVAVVLAVVWWLRRPKAPEVRSEQPQPDPRKAIEPMVVCAHCGLHLPQREAVRGALGPYCSDAHRIDHGDGR